MISQQLTWFTINRFGFTMAAFLAMFIYMWIFFAVATGDSTSINPDDVNVFWVSTQII